MSKTIQSNRSKSNGLIKPNDMGDCMGLQTKQYGGQVSYLSLVDSVGQSWLWNRLDQVCQFDYGSINLNEISWIDSLK